MIVSFFTRRSSQIRCILVKPLTSLESATSKLSFLYWRLSRVAVTNIRCQKKWFSFKEQQSQYWDKKEKERRSQCFYFMSALFWLADMFSVDLCFTFAFICWFSLKTSSYMVTKIRVWITRDLTGASAFNWETKGSFTTMLVSWVGSERQLSLSPKSSTQHQHLPCACEMQADLTKLLFFVPF